jgi:hypothetical protein
MSHIVSSSVRSLYTLPRMADHPEAKQITTGDRTSAWVAAGLVLLAVTGVATVFSDSIAAVWSPPPAAEPPPVVTPVVTPASPAPAPLTDGGHA